MTRLIDADALKEELRNSWIRKAKMPMEADPFLAFAMSDIDNAPTIDAEPVVRCKDCEYWTKQNKSLQGRCALSGSYPTGAWYCANAERREP